MVKLVILLLSLVFSLESNEIYKPNSLSETYLIGNIEEIAQLYNIEKIPESSNLSVISPVISYFSLYNSPQTLEISLDGQLSFLNPASSVANLPKTVQDIVTRSPIELPHMPNTLLIGSKNTKLFTVNNQFQLEEIHEFGRNEIFLNLIGRVEYSILGIGKSNGEKLWNLNYTYYTVINPGENLEELVTAGESTSMKRWRDEFIKDPSILQMWDINSYFVENMYYYDEVMSIFRFENSSYIGLILDWSLANCYILFSIFIAVCIGFCLGKIQNPACIPCEQPVIVSNFSPRLRIPSNPDLETSDTDRNMTEKAVILSPMSLAGKSESSREKISEFKLEESMVLYTNNNQTCELPDHLEKELFREKFPLPEFEKYAESASVNTEITIEKLENSYKKIEKHTLTKTYRVENQTEITDLLVKAPFHLRADAEKINDKTSISFMAYPDGEFKELMEILDNGNYAKKFLYLRVLGTGGFSSVHLAKHKLDAQLYAIKIVRMRVREAQNIKNHKLFTEVNTLKKLQSKYVVRYITCWAELEEKNSSLAIESAESSFSIMQSCESSDISMSFDNEKYLNVLLHMQMEYCDGMSLRE